jgi:DNA-binding transcriptional MerR regulator
MHESSKLVRQEELINLLLLHIPLRECAERCHVSYATIRKYASEPDFLNNLRVLSQSVYAEVVADLKFEKKSLKQQMTEASDTALRRLEQLLQSAQEGIALKAADSILDRCSETARNRKVEGDFNNRFTLDPLSLMHAANTAQEIAQSSFERDASRESGEQK